MQLRITLPPPPSPTLPLRPHLSRKPRVPKKKKIFSSLSFGSRYISQLSVFMWRVQTVPCCFEVMLFRPHSLCPPSPHPTHTHLPRRRSPFLGGGGQNLYAHHWTHTRNGQKRRDGKTDGRRIMSREPSLERFSTQRRLLCGLFIIHTLREIALFTLTAFTSAPVLAFRPKRSRSIPKVRCDVHCWGPVNQQLDMGGGGGEEGRTQEGGYKLYSIITG